MIQKLIKDSTFFLIGLIFALGLGLSGMTDPAKVIGFLDITGAWDPALALVMAAALAVTTPAFMLLKRRNKPLFHTQFHLPEKIHLEPRLIAGAALFGIGWGLAGICPGPAIVNFSGGAAGLPVFLVTMTLGMALVPFLEKTHQRRKAVAGVVRD